MLYISGHKLVTNPLIYLAEAVLVLLFVTHFAMALKLSLENARARGSKYAVASNGEKGTSVIQKTMWHQGVIILVFTVLHLITFKYGPGKAEGYSIVYAGVEMRNLFQLVIDVFQSPAYVFGYVFCMGIIFFHLGHGVSSAVQTLGFNHPQYTPKIKLFSWLFAAFVAGGFALQPLYVFFIYSPA